MKTLEDELGVRLFDRLGKKIAITEAGKIILEQCKLVFANFESAKKVPLKSFQFECFCTSPLKGVEPATVTRSATCRLKNVLRYIVASVHA